MEEKGLEKKYWLHRISNEWEVSYTLLDKGYISYGWRRFAHNKEILEAARRDDEKEFEKIYSSIENKKYRSRWNLWNFAKFNIGDCVLVPLFNGKFSLYQVVNPAIPINEIERVIGEFKDKKGQNIVWNGGLLQRKSKDIDVGFVVKVKPIEIEISRNEYADSALTARMKMRQSNGDIEDLKTNVDTVIKAVKANNPINFYENAVKDGSKSLLERIKRDLNPDKFQLLVKAYMTKIGADNTYIPPRNEKGKKDNADADVISVFENLKVSIQIQAKFHDDISSDWAVEQIIRYKNLLEDKDIDFSHEYEDECTIIPWVISCCDDFSDEAKAKARKYKVRLINGLEFSRMIINAGLSQINIE